jgi:hypothetical protein
MGTAWYVCISLYVDDLNSGLDCMENFTEQPSIWCCSLGTFCCTISGKREPSTFSCLQSRGLQFLLQVCCSKNSTGKRERKRDCVVPLCMTKCFKLHHTIVNRGNVFCADFVCLFNTFLYASTGITCSYLYYNQSMIFIYQNVVRILQYT